LSSARALFANSNFRLLWIGRGISELGDFFGELALSWLVVTITGSALALSLNLLLFFLPRSVIRLFAGVYVDRWNRRNIMIWTETIRGALFAGLGLLSLIQTLALLLIYSVSFLIGLFGALFDLATEALLPLLVDKSSLLRANSLFTATFQIDNVLGPALAGFTIFLLGTGIPLLIDSASFFVLVLVLLLIRAPKWQSSSSGSKGGWYKDFKEGLEFFRQRNELVWLAVIVSVINFALGAFWNVYLLIFARDFLLVGSSGWGLLSATSAAGVLAGSLLLGRRAKIRRRRVVIIISLLSLGLGVVIFSLTTNLLSSLLVILIIGLTIPFSDVVIVTIYQEIVPPELMGRVFGVRFFLAYMLIPVSLLFGGVATVLFGVVFSVFVSGLLILLLGVVTVFVGSLRKLDSAGFRTKSPDLRGALGPPHSPQK